MTQRIQYNEEMVGDSHPTKADTLNRFVNLITTVGDILVGTATATAKRVALGSARLLWGVNAAGNDLEYLTFPKFSANKGGVDQLIAPITWTKVTFTTEDWDVGLAYDAPNSKWIPGIIGKVNISAKIKFLTMADAVGLAIAIYLNGVISSSILYTANVTSQGLQISHDIPIDAITDEIEIYCYQGSVGNRDVEGNLIYSRFTGHLLP